jgi:hypothetical protein
VEDIETTPEEANPTVSEILDKWLLYPEIRWIPVAKIDTAKYTPVRGIHRSGIEKLKYMISSMQLSWYISDIVLSYHIQSSHWKIWYWLLERQCLGASLSWKESQCNCRWTTPSSSHT